MDGKLAMRNQLLCSRLIIDLTCPSGPHINRVTDTPSKIVLGIIALHSISRCMNGNKSARIQLKKKNLLECLPAALICFGRRFAESLRTQRAVLRLKLEIQPHHENGSRQRALSQALAVL